MAEKEVATVTGKAGGIEVFLGESTISPEKHQVVLSKSVLDTIGAGSGDKVRFRVGWTRDPKSGDPAPVVIIEKKPGP